MELSPKAKNILSQFNSKTKPGDLRAMSKEIKKDHERLWNFGLREGIGAKIIFMERECSGHLD